jgi:hypothetical protein
VSRPVQSFCCYSVISVISVNSVDAVNSVTSVVAVALVVCLLLLLLLLLLLFIPLLGVFPGPWPLAPNSERPLPSPRQRLLDLMRRPKREGAEGERGVGTASAQRGRRAGDEQILVVVRAPLRVHDAGRRVAAHAAPTRRMILKIVHVRAHQAPAAGARHVGEQRLDGILGAPAQRRRFRSILE